MSSPKTPKTLQRRRLSLKEKIKIIEDSKKPGFDKAKVMKEYGISRPTIINILKNQFDTLKAVDSGTFKIEINKNSYCYSFINIVFSSNKY